MNEPTRKRKRIAAPQGISSIGKNIAKYGGFERYRDNRPGRYAITGAFIKLPDAPTRSSSQ